MVSSGKITNRRDLTECAKEQTNCYFFVSPRTEPATAAVSQMYKKKENEKGVQSAFDSYMKIDFYRANAKGAYK